MEWPVWPTLNAVIEGLQRASRYLMVSSGCLLTIFSKHSPNQHLHFDVHIEPKGVVVDAVNTTSFSVSLQAPAGNRGISRFEVLLEGGCIVKKCKLSKSASPLQCQFGGLLAATKYVVNVRSCLPKSIGCSTNVTLLVATTPDGVFYSMFLFTLKNLYLMPISLCHLSTGQLCLRRHHGKQRQS